MAYHEGVDWFGLELLVGVTDGLTARRIQLHRTLGQRRVRTTACTEKGGAGRGRSGGERRGEGKREGVEGLPEAVLMAASASMSPTGGGTQEQSQASDGGAWAAAPCATCMQSVVCIDGVCLCV